MNKYLFSIIWAVVFLFFISSCKPKEVKEQEANQTVFKYNEPGGVSSLDPAFARNIENVWVVNQIFNGLVQMDNNLEVKPCIAHKWEISPDGTEYTFYLRNDVFFHDNEVFKGGNGRKLTASDFVYSFTRIMNPDFASPGSYVFQYLDKSERSNYVGVVAVNENTLKIYLKKPFTPFLGILTMHYCCAIAKEAVDYYGADFRRNPVGTGPFMFKTWKEGTKLVLVKNPNYFERENGLALPYLDAVSITFVKDRQLSFLDFVRGKYDFISGFDASFKDMVFTQDGNLVDEYKGKFRVEKHPYLKTDYIGILIDEKLDLVKKSPLKIKAIRQAINYGFDRDKMVKYLRNNIGIPAVSGFIPAGMPSFDKEKVKGFTYNPKRSAELLYIAGYPEGKGLPPITLTTTSPYQDLCEYMQHELSAIGINTNVEVIDEATYREMVAQAKLNVFKKSWVADYPDAENFLSLFYSQNFSPQGPNYTHFNNYKFDRLYERAMITNNPEERYELYRQMDQLLIDESPVIPLYYDEAVRLVQNEIQGLAGNPMNLLNLKTVKKIKQEILEE